MSLASVFCPLPPLARGSACSFKVDTKTGEKLLYGHGNTVVLRDIQPGEDGKIDTMIYAQHSYPVTAAAMAPSGAYIASGDERGTLRVWACDTPDQILKGEFPLFAGKVLDIAVGVLRTHTRGRLADGHALTRRHLRAPIVRSGRATRSAFSPSATAAPSSARSSCGTRATRSAR